MSDKTGLNILENRLRKIEQRIYGISDQHDENLEVVSRLSELATNLDSALSTRDRMKAVMKRVDELDEYLDPCYGTGPSQLSDGAMTDLLLAQEDHWHEQHQQLQRISDMKHVLDSKNIEDCVHLSDKLIGVSLKQSELDEMSREQAERVSNLMQTYNTILQTLTETLVRMDDVVTKAEIAAQPKKILD